LVFYDEKKFIDKFIYFDVGSTDTGASASKITRVTHSSLAAPLDQYVGHRGLGGVGVVQHVAIKG
jgi:hypothetical protein